MPLALALQVQVIAPNAKQEVSTKHSLMHLVQYATHAGYALQDLHLVGNHAIQEVFWIQYHASAMMKTHTLTEVNVFHAEDATQTQLH
jgi:hypothetical protein